MFAQDNENVGCMDVAALNYSAENDISEPSLCEYPTECLENQQLVMIDISIGNWSSEITWDIMDSGGTIVANIFKYVLYRLSDLYYICMFNN